MGTLNYIHDDLFNTRRLIIGHGISCAGVFGAGIARQIAQKFPEARRSYLRKYRDSGWRLGEVQFVYVAYNKVVANMATQASYGRGREVYVDYEAIRLCFEQLLDFCRANGQGVAIPKIGAGLGGGDWVIIERTICECLRTRNVEVDVHVID